MATAASPKPLRVSVMDGRFAVCRLSPEWSSGIEDFGGAFLSVTRTADEVSVVCSEDDAPDSATVEGGWRAMRVIGKLDFSEVAVISTLSTALADAEIPVFVVSTFDTDYVLVKENRLEDAVVALSRAAKVEAAAGSDPSSVAIRPVSGGDDEFLWEMLSVAARSDADALTEPGVSRYLDGWGREGDVGFVAEDPASGEPLGAAWARLFTADEPAYGFVDETTPEMAVGVRESARGRGVGSALISRLTSEVGVKHPALSLSVRRDNPATRLYERIGFEVVEDEEGEASVTMRLDLLAPKKHPD